MKMSVSTRTQEEEIINLQEENQYLSEDLRQCQADKEFVWSLWKKLQVANPDVTKAIALVLQREKEKAEIKDRKVLEILQLKDDKIEELQTLVELRSKELSEISLRNEDAQDNVEKFQAEMASIRERNTQLEMQAEASLKSFENREKSKDELHKSLLENLQQKNIDLQVKVEMLTSELETAHAEKADCIAQRVNLEDKARMLEADVTNKITKFEGMVSEFEEAKRLLHRYETQTQQLKKDVDFKDHELENVRKELSELWGSHNQLTEHSSQQADLIRQLQSLQVDTQKMLKNQEDAYSIEATSLQDMYTELTTRYNKSKHSESDLRHQLHTTKKELLEKDDTIAGLQSKVDSLRRKHRNTSAALSGSFLAEDRVENEEAFMDLECRVKGMQKEINLLREKLAEKDREIDRLENVKDISDIEFDVARLNRHERTHSTPSQDLSKLRSPQRSEVNTKHSRSRSLSPTGQRDLKLRLVQTERKLEDTRNLLKLRNRELQELKRSHAKRIDRLKDIQSNYRLVKEQLKTMEEEHYGNKRKKKVKRADTKDLRKENSDGVWNELAYYKNDNRTLTVDKLNLEEELDALRVQASQDAATKHELQVALEQEREKRQHDKRKADIKTQARTDQAAEIQLLQSEVLNKNLKIERLGRDIQDILGEKEGLQEEKRIVKAELFELKQEAAQHRIEMADLRHRIKRLEQELDEEKTKSHILQNAKDRHTVGKSNVRAATKARRRDSKTRAARQYQRALNKSIEKMRAVFENFEEEGWEEISESPEEETESDTLGRAIVTQSQMAMSPVDDSSSFSSGYRMKSKSRPSMNLKLPLRTRRRNIRNAQKCGHPSQSATSNTAASSSSVDPVRTVVLREAATSPMRSCPKQRTVSPSKMHEQKLLHNQTVRQLKQMKQRVLNLQQQITNLKDSRAATLKVLGEQKEVNQQLESDLNLANQRLRMNKQNIQKLSNDIEKLQQEKVQLENQLTAKSENHPSVPPADKHTEQDWKVLEARLKASSNEVCRQSAAMRQLKQDNTGLQEQVRTLQDRINHLERDNSQKRNLLEDTRTKLRLTQENSRSDANTVEELETRIKLLQDGADRSRIQIESLKKRLGAVTREKRDYEERFLKTHNELERKTKQLLDCQNRKMELESSVSELESTAQQQLRGLATQSEAAIEAAQEKLGLAYRQIHLYQQFVKNLGQDLIKKVIQTRQHVKEAMSQKDTEACQPVNASLQKAQDLAKDILNLSQSDMDEIMSADGDPDRLGLESDASADKRKDRRWTKKCDKLLNSKDEFVLPLVELFVQKIEERCELLKKLHTNLSIS